MDSELTEVQDNIMKDNTMKTITDKKKIKKNRKLLGKQQWQQKVEKKQTRKPTIKPLYIFALPFEWYLIAFGQFRMNLPHTAKEFHQS